MAHILIFDYSFGSLVLIISMINNFGANSNIQYLLKFVWISSNLILSLIESDLPFKLKCIIVFAEANLNCQYYLNR